MEKVEWIDYSANPNSVVEHTLSVSSSNTEYLTFYNTIHKPYVTSCTLGSKM